MLLLSGLDGYFVLDFESGFVYYKGVKRNLLGPNSAGHGREPMFS